MPRILLADDYQLCVRLVREILETETGFSVCAEASDGLEAVTLTASRAPGHRDTRSIHARTERPGSRTADSRAVSTHRDTDSHHARSIRDDGRSDRGPVYGPAFSKPNYDQPRGGGTRHLARAAEANPVHSLGRAPETPNNLSVVADAVEHPAHALTEFERQIVQMLAQAKSNKEIAPPFPSR